MFTVLPPMIPSDFMTIAVGDGIDLMLDSFGSYISIVIGVVVFGLVVGFVIDLISNNKD